MPLTKKSAQGIKQFFVDERRSDQWQATIGFALQFIEEAREVESIIVFHKLQLWQHSQIISVRLDEFQTSRFDLGARRKRKVFFLPELNE